MDVNGDVQKVKDNLAVQSEGAALATSALDVYGKYAEQKAKESNAALEAKLTAEGKLNGSMTAVIHPPRCCAGCGRRLVNRRAGWCC